jgi:hypothetical protein
VDGKLIVAGEVEVSELPLARVAIATAGVISTTPTLPLPLGPGAVWKKLEKPAPVVVVPLLVTVAEYV